MGSASSVHREASDMSAERLQDYDELTIRLIDFEKFKFLSEFPRYPDNHDLTTTLDLIDRQESLIVYISHSWLRRGPRSEGWTGIPHPDDAHNNKYKLCVEGIEHVMNLAPRMKSCFVWMDYGCLDQNSAGSSVALIHKIVECSDLLFTPIHDPECSWSYPNGWSNYYQQYAAPSWRDGPHAYLNRAWCRLEMFYAAHIPIQNVAGSDAKRCTLFDAGLKVLIERGQRPHLLYGTKEMNQNRQPWIIPPLMYSHLTAYDPKIGMTTRPGDAAIIASLMEKWSPYVTSLNVGYIGEKNDAGQKHGRGKYTWDTGMVYEGDWQNDVFHGRGVLSYASGDRYEGEFADGMMHGQGTLQYSGNGTYIGLWKNNLYDGYGMFIYPNGTMYKGTFLNGQKHGEGVETVQVSKTKYENGNIV